MADHTKIKFGRTFRYQSISDSLVGSGTYGRVFTGHFKSSLYTSWNVGSDAVKAAIKRVEINFERGLDIENDREYVALKELRHPFIVTLYAVEDDDDFRNYVFELCQANLEDFITGKYAGLMPDEIEGLYQMTSGLKFIHEKKMIHRDIKPENVLISLTNGSACFKIADLGFTKPLNEDGIYYDLASGLKGTKYYMAPELLVLRNLHVLEEKCTISSDVFAAGCTFFRYLAGLHPFGKGFDIERNIVAGNPINATVYVGEKWKIDLIVKMITFNPNERPSLSKILIGLQSLGNHLEAQNTELSFPPPPLVVVEGGCRLPVIVVQNSSVTGTINVGKVQIHRHNPIGRGGFGVVFTGILNDEKVAVKRVQHVTSTADYYNNTELIIYRTLSNHPNIVKFKHYEEYEDFQYFVMELCAASLNDYIHGKYKESMPTDEQVIFQLASGLEYIHSRNILHQNVKPENILISLKKPVQMKYCDFGSSKRTNERGTCSFSGIKGTPNWKSPEELIMIEKKLFDTCRRSVKSDVFSAGCVFIFFLLRGKHPFGDASFNILTNIMNGNPVNVKELPMDHFARPFVIKMIEHDPLKRISLSEVIDHLKPLQPSSRLSLCQYDNQNLLCSRGTFSLVYRVETFEISQLAVKKVPIKKCNTESFEELRQLNHSNIVRFLQYDEDDIYKYFGMEWCVASLDQLFLPEEDPKKYKNPIPSDEQFCFQLISALHYIHKERNFVHGSIKPTNILISSSEDPQIKLSDFGLTSTCLNEGHESTREISGFLSSCYWLAPELLDPNNGQNEPTKESDIFAAGSVSFYFLSKGFHLFGDEIHKIITNTSNGIPKNIFSKLSKSPFPSGLIRWMTSKVPGDRPKTEEISRHLNLIKPLPPPENLRKIGDIHFSIDHFLEAGGQGNVFIGKWNDSEVAVKRIGPIDTLTADKKAEVYRERDNYQELNHDYIAKLLAFGEDNYFMYLALERCLTSLDDYCRKPQLYQGIIPMPSDQEVLLQMAEGLQYIHSKDLIHRDVKPGNILISYGNPAVIKWADFGMTRTVITGSKTFSWSKLQGTDRWQAPELIEANQEKKIKGSQKCDIFALGCVFFFFLVPGIHPFGYGTEYSTQNNIKNNDRVNFDRLPVEHFATDIIKGMIENDRESRSKLPDVIRKLVDIGPNTEKATVRVSNNLLMSPFPAKKPRKETIKKK